MLPLLRNGMLLMKYASRREFEKKDKPFLIVTQWLTGIGLTLDIYLLCG
jgi:hypothetical protein